MLFCPSLLPLSLLFSGFFVFFLCPLRRTAETVRARQVQEGMALCYSIPQALSSSFTGSGLGIPRTRTRAESLRRSICFAPDIFPVEQVSKTHTDQRRSGHRFIVFRKHELQTLFETLLLKYFNVFQKL